MPSNRLYVGNLPFSATEEDVKDFFRGFTVKYVKLILDHETNRPRGFCFVEIGSVTEMNLAIEKLHGQTIGDRPIVVSIAKEKPRPAQAARPQKTWE